MNEAGGGTIEGSKKRKSATGWRRLPALVGLGLALVLVLRLGPAQIAGELLSVGPGFLLMPAAYGVGQMVRAFGLSVLLAPGQRPGAAASIASRFAASSLNDLLPLFGVGGDASRLLWFPARLRPAVLPALVLDRILLIVSDGIFVVAVTIAALASAALPRRLELDAAVAIAAMLAVGSGLLWIARRRGLAVPALKLLALGGFRSVSGKLGQAREVDAAVRETLSQRPNRTVANLLIQLASRLLLAAETWLGLALLHVEVSALGALIIAAVPMAVSVTFTFVPSQVGAQEGAMALVFAALHLHPSTGIALSLLFRIRLIIVLPLGFLFLSRAPRHGA